MLLPALDLSGYFKLLELLIEMANSRVNPFVATSTVEILQKSTTLTI